MAWIASEAMEDFIERSLADANDEVRLFTMLRVVYPMLCNLPEIRHGLAEDIAERASTHTSQAAANYIRQSVETAWPAEWQQIAVAINRVLNRSE